MWRKISAHADGGPHRRERNLLLIYNTGHFHDFFHLFFRMLPSRLSYLQTNEIKGEEAQNVAIQQYKRGRGGGYAKLSRLMTIWRWKCEI